MIKIFQGMCICPGMYVCIFWFVLSVGVVYVTCMIYCRTCFLDKMWAIRIMYNIPYRPLMIYIDSLCVGDLSVDDISVDDLSVYDIYICR